jgi:hypothetical protein
MEYAIVDGTPLARPLSRTHHLLTTCCIKEADMTDKPTGTTGTTQTNYAGRSQEERRAQRKGEKQRAQEQPGGAMAEEGTEPDSRNSAGKLSDEGKKAWQTGSGIDGGGKT